MFFLPRALESSAKAALLLLLFFPATASGRTLLRSPETSNVTPEEAKSITQLFRSAYAGHAETEVVLAPAPPSPPKLIPLPEAAPAPSSAEAPAPSQPTTSARPVAPAPVSPAPVQPAPVPPAPSTGVPAQTPEVGTDAASPAAPATSPGSQAQITHAERQRIYEQNQAAQRQYERDYSTYQALLDADEYLELVLIRLQNRIQIRAARYERDGAQVHSVKTTVSNLDDAPEAVDRLAYALAEGISYEETATLDNITSEETGTPVRQGAEVIAGVKTGFVFPYSPRQAFDGYIAIGFDLRLESQNYFIELGAGVGMPYFVSDTFESGSRWQSGGVYTEIAFNGYLTRTEMSPYLGMGVSPRLWFTNDGGGMNLMPFAQAGMMFLRSSKTRFYSDFRAGYSVTRLGYTSSGREVRPFEFGMNIGVGW